MTPRPPTSTLFPYTTLFRSDAFRRPERFRELLVACEADHRGRGGRAGEPYPQAERLRAAQARAMSVALDDADREGLSGEDRKSTRLNSSHGYISYAVFCLKK